jgi:hypothetical protein
LQMLILYLCILAGCPPISFLCIFLMAIWATLLQFQQNWWYWSPNFLTSLMIDH